MFIDTIGSECLGKKPMKDDKGETWYCACKICESNEDKNEEVVEEDKPVKRTRRTKAEMLAFRSA